LNVSFGWLPFISDCQRIYNSVSDFRKKVLKLQKDSKIPQKRHYRRWLDTVSLPLGSQLFNDGVNKVNREIDWVERPQYCATVDYVYVLPDMSDPLNQAKAFLDSIGFQLDAGIVWNAMPYSFVIDWFFNVGDWIHKFRVDNLKIPATVTGFCHSLKWEYRVRYVYSSSATATNLGDKMVVLADRNILRYERRLDVPSWGLLDYTVRTPNWRQLALASSLIVQSGGALKRLARKLSR